MQKLEISVLIPALNEEKSIAATVNGVRDVLQEIAVYEIIVIDDGSTDETARTAEALNVRVIRNPNNLGYGASLKRGLTQSKYPLVLITDADGTYPIDAIPRLLKFTVDNDMVVGARTGANVAVPFLRRPGKWIITKLAEYLSRTKIPDLNSGLRIFRRETAVRFLSLYPDGFSFTTTITLAMLTNGFLVHFEPIDYHKRIGKSSIKPIRDFTNFCILIVRICAFFRPLNVFVPPALCLMIVGFAKGFHDYMSDGYLGLLSVAVFLAGLQMLFIALLADLIDNRMKL
jgi:glycosyltransferase involved in cell wall biosynthesis